MPLRDLERELAAASPALLRISDSRFLVVLHANRRRLLVLTPMLVRERVSLDLVCAAIREPFEAAAREPLEDLLAESGVSGRTRKKSVALLLQEQFGNKRWNRCWILRLEPGGKTVRLLCDAGAIENGTAMVAAHIVQYLLWFAAWAVIGRLSFEGRMDRGWLFAWALLLITLLPFQVLTTWMQGLFTVGLGGFLKRRLLCGALKLAPEEMRHAGIGTFLGQSLEAEAVERLALSGGVPGVLATTELFLAMSLLGQMSLVLAGMIAMTILAAAYFVRRYDSWTETRMNLTQDLVESMVGHRTRLAQQKQSEWHSAEDQGMLRYLLDSHTLDRAGTVLVAAIPRAWLIVGLGCLAPGVIGGAASVTQTAIKLGGVLLAYTALRKLTGASADIAAAWVAWRRIAPLTDAAQRRELPGELATTAKSERRSHRVLEADRLMFRYRANGNPVVHGCDLVVLRGDRILLQGPSGGGKTTFASLLSGVRKPESGLLLVNGLDRPTLGSEGWRKAIAAAPQFHENYILTETLAFNLLMGRCWPPTQADLDEAEEVCRELGLGELLDSMPSGLMQMVGEGGWQLSHGERSRVYIARALLKNADLVILDESFAALDPENAKRALEYTIQRAESLMVIAHP